MKRVLAAIVSGFDRLFSDPGSRPPLIKTGQVIVAPAPAGIRGTGIEGVGYAARRIFPATAIVPPERVRRISPTVEERWVPIPGNVDHLSFNEITQLANSGQLPVAGWEVTYHRVASKDRWAQMTAEEIREHVLSLSLSPADDATYNGYYPTIKGRDVAHHDPTKQGMAAFRGGQALKGNPTVDANGRVTHDGTIRGGTEIRGGRAEYRRATKGYEPFDAGYFKHVDRIKADLQAKRDKKHQIAQEKADARLPRNIGEL